MLIAFSSSGSHSSFSGGSSFHSSSSFSSSGYHSAPSTSSFGSFGTGYHSVPTTTTDTQSVRTAGQSAYTSTPVSTVNHYYDNGGNMFWNYMFWNSMLNRPQYVVGGPVPYGYTVSGNQYVARPQTIIGGVISLIVLLALIGAIIWLFTRSFRSEY